MNVYANAKLATPGQPGSLYVWCNAYTWQGQPGGQVMLGHYDETTNAPDKIASGMPDTVSISGQDATITAPVDFGGIACKLKLALHSKSCDWDVKPVAGGASVWTGSTGYDWAGIVLTPDGGAAVQINVP